MPSLKKEDDVGKALTGMQVTNTKFMDNKIVLNFETKNERDNAAEKMKEVPNVTIKQVKKMDPSIMICNVSKEESKEDMIQNLIERNESLKSVDDIENKIRYVFDKPAYNEPRHYVFRCDPEVRKLLRLKYDNIKLQWGIYNICDRYITTTCFYCMKFGHIESKCPAKANNENPTCGRCAGDHRTSTCKEETNNKCINCVNLKKKDTNHMVNQKGCEALQAEINKIIVLISYH